MRNKRTSLIVLSITAFLGTALVVGCAGSATPVSTAMPPSENQVPAEVLQAQEAALDFLRVNANDCVPPKGVRWTVVQGGDAMPEGYSVYRFDSGGCMMSVSYPLPKTEQTVYHVSLGDAEIGICWQATVDRRGKVLATGGDAEQQAGKSNAASAYCEKQGYTYETRTHSNGVTCGTCIFPDGSTCVGWAFLRGQCKPGDHPASTN